MSHNAHIIYISRGAGDSEKHYMFYSNGGRNFGFASYGLFLHYGGYLQRLYWVGDEPEFPYLRK